MQKDIIEVRADGRPRERREYSEAFKRRIVAATFEAGASVSRIAQRHGINTNLVFTWRRQRRYRLASEATTAALVPVTIAEQPRQVAMSTPTQVQMDTRQAYIEVEVGATRLRLHGAVDLGVLAGVLGLVEGQR